MNKKFLAPLVIIASIGIGWCDSEEPQNKHETQISLKEKVIQDAKIQCGISWIKDCIATKAIENLKLLFHKIWCRDHDEVIKARDEILLDYPGVYRPHSAIWKPNRELEWPYKVTENIPPGSRMAEVYNIIDKVIRVTKKKHCPWKPNDDYCVAKKAMDELRYTEFSKACNDQATEEGAYLLHNTTQARKVLVTQYPTIFIRWDDTNGWKCGSAVVPTTYNPSKDCINTYFWSTCRK